MTEADIRLAMEAMWDNSIDGRQADRLGVDFDEIERINQSIFEQWLMRTNSNA